jgi:hypothetical protein
MDMANTCELLINIVRPKEPKELTGFGQTATQMVNLLDSQIAQTTNLPVNRQRLQPCIVKLTEQGKPNRSPARADGSQVKLMSEWVKDRAKSE